MNHWGTSRFTALLIAGAVTGITAYCISRWWYRCAVRTRPIMEAGACGGGIIAGVHLAFGALFPSLLVHLVDGAGNHVELPAGAALSIGEVHCLHIFLGGVATAVIAGGGLWRFCSKPKARPEGEHEVV